LLEDRLRGRFERYLLTDEEGTVLVSSLSASKLT